ncbi:hypothetical protein TNIN_465971 [Trichonephila inaurata madagascariensis]|uniref:Secreted protein n=1 Tax=Trichonephila inaurata madagascariensis TaxID=2747483 RepID=A0A8X6X9M1_9ARAC|nr:hypothetical protein TNIN_465971 [Trichonephila inaurata madagascariensis]
MRSTFCFISAYLFFRRVGCASAQRRVRVQRPKIHCTQKFQSDFNPSGYRYGLAGDDQYAASSVEPMSHVTVEISLPDVAVGRLETIRKLSVWIILGMPKLDCTPGSNDGRP